MRAPIRISALVPLFMVLLLANPATAIDSHSSGVAETGPPVLWATFQGTIGSISSNYLVDAVAEAEARRAALLVIELDTPGGLDTSMRSIVKAILSSEVPVVTFVSPSGSRAASAGVFIALASHAVVMAPGTNIGAAHPVNMAGGQSDSVMTAKVTNDAVAYIRGLAEQHGRDPDWAEDAVRNSVSISAEEALDAGIADAMAGSRRECLEQLHGFVVEIDGDERPLELENASIEEFPMSRRYRILSLLNDPTVAYMLLMFGFYGIFFELSNPGSVAPGVIGAICLVLGLFALQSIPINYAGLLLMGLGLALFAIELFTPTFGIFTAGGVIALTAGSFLLFRSADPVLRVSLPVIITAVAVSSGFFVFAITMAMRARFQKPSTGRQSMVGTQGEARTDLSPLGTVFVDGTHWNAEAGEHIDAGEVVIITKVDGLTLHVRRAD